MWHISPYGQVVYPLPHACRPVTATVQSMRVSNRQLGLCERGLCALWKCHLTFCIVFFQWNETIELFRDGMPQKRHRVHFKIYEKCFTASEAVDWLHVLLQCNQNFGPQVTRDQTIQLLKKFTKNHVVEDVKGRWGKEDFEDNNNLYRWNLIINLHAKVFPSSSSCH